MALHYLAGSQVGLNLVYDDLLTFAVSTCGWTLAETVATRDKIIKSQGEDGKSDMVFELLVSTAARNPFKVNYNPHVKFPYIMAMGWNAWTPGAPGTGFKPFGQVGPWIFSGSTTLSSAQAADTARIFRYSSPSFPIVTIGSTDAAYVGRTRRVKTADSFENPSQVFDGRRKVLGFNNVTQTQMGWSDLSHGEANLSSGGIPPTSFGTAGILPCLVHDTVNDKDLLFSLNPTATLANQWLRYDIETNTWNTMAPPTWTASTTTGGAAVWDGADTIYVLHGNTTTEFAKYSISGNSWTNLTAAAVARATAFTVGGNGCTTNMVYVPNSLSGIGEDVIYVILAASGTVIYRYDVTANAWRSTSGTGALTAQQTIGASTFLLFDGQGFLFHGTTAAAPGNWYRSTVTVPNTWTNLGIPQSLNTRSHNGLIHMNHVPAKVRSHATQTTNYWFLGDKDSITVVVKVNTATPHYYWMYFGRFSSSNRTAKMTATAGISPGGRVTVTVDDTSAYSAGEPILIWDQASGAVERSLIYAIDTPTTFRANVSGTYTAGARIGLDPTPWCAVGNGFALCPNDPMGYGSDNETSQYVAEPLPDSNAVKRSSPGSGGLYQPVPITIFNDDTTTSKNQNRGFLKNTFSMSTGPNPQPQPEDTVKIAGKTYIFFPDTETSRYTVDTRGILIGPID